MAKINFWMVRHKPTGFYLPEPEGRMGRGGSWVEPADPNEKQPRLCPSEVSAKRYLASWLRGRVHHSSGYDSFHGEYYEDTELEKVESRKKEEMEIVKVSIPVP